MPCLVSRPRSDRVCPRSLTRSDRACPCLLANPIDRARRCSPDPIERARRCSPDPIERASDRYAIGYQKWLGAYGSIASCRARLISRASGRWCFAQVPEIRRGVIFPVSVMNSRSVFTSL